MGPPFSSALLVQEHPAGNFCELTVFQGNLPASLSPKPKEATAFSHSSLVLIPIFFGHNDPFECKIYLRPPVQAPLFGADNNSPCVINIDFVQKKKTRNFKP